MALSILGSMLITGDQNRVGRRRREVTDILLSESPAIRYSAWEEEIFGKIQSRCRTNPDLMRVLVFLEAGEGVDRHMRILRRSLLDDEAFDWHLSELARVLDGEDMEADVPNWLLRRYPLEIMNRLWNKMPQGLKTFLSTCKDKVLACAFKFLECCSWIFSTIKNYFMGITLGPDALNALFYGAIAGGLAGAIAAGIAGGMMVGPPAAVLGLIGGGLGGGFVGGLSGVALQKLKVYTAVKERFFDRPAQEAIEISYELIGVEPSSSCEDLQEHFVEALERSNSETEMVENIVARGIIEASRYSS